MDVFLRTPSHHMTSMSSTGSGNSHQYRSSSACRSRNLLQAPICSNCTYIEWFHLLCDIVRSSVFNLTSTCLKVGEQEMTCCIKHHETTSVHHEFYTFHRNFSKWYHPMPTCKSPYPDCSWNFYTANLGMATLKMQKIMRLSPLNAHGYEIGQPEVFDKASVRIGQWKNLGSIAEEIARQTETKDCFSSNTCKFDNFGV